MPCKADNCEKNKQFYLERCYKATNLLYITMARDIPTYDEDQWDSLVESANNINININDDLPSYAAGIGVRPVEHQSIYSSIVTVVTDKPLDFMYDVGDIISGQIRITPKNDMTVGLILVDLHFESIVSRSDILNFNQSKHIALLDKSIVPEQAYPDSHVFRQGFTYDFSFSMVIPENIPAEVNHCTLAGHTKLPQSMGSLFEGTPSREDIGDSGTRVVYYVRARLTNPKPPSTLSSIPKILAQGQRPFIFRSSAMGPEFELYKNKDGSPFFQQDYYSIEKPLSMGLLKRNHIGTIQLRIQQCPVVKLPPDFMAESSESLTNMMPVTMIFAPRGSQPPPEMVCIYVKLTAYSLSSRESVDHYMTPYEKNVNTYADTISTQTMKLGKSTWIASGSREKITYTSQISFPFRFPVCNKTRIPTFYNCLIARTYEISLTLSFNGFNNKVAITTPLYVYAGMDCSRSAVSIRGSVGSRSFLSDPENRFSPYPDNAAPAYEVESSCTDSSSSIAQRQEDMTPRQVLHQQDYEEPRPRKNNVMNSFGVASIR